MRKAAFILLLLLPFAHAAATDQVIWIATDYPPAHIIEGELASQGFVDIITRYLSEHLTGFSHVVRLTPNRRAWALAAEQDGVCIPGAIDIPERHEHTVYSRVAMATFGPELLVRRDELDRFSPFRDAAGEIDLDRLAADPTLHAARTTDRPLGAIIDQFSLLHGEPQLAGLPNAHLPLTMLEKGRVDYVFGYATEIFYNRIVHPDGVDMAALQIAGQPRILYTYVACSNGPIGRRVIAQIDRLLGSGGAPPPYFEATRRWYSPEDFRELAALARWP
jgi:uncharacterized protein (TIGR02285 family)